MKVIFLFMSSKSAPPDAVLNDDWKKQNCAPHYDRVFGDECYFQMLESLVADGTISDLKVFFESNNGPGKANFVKGADCYVVPHVSQIEEFIDDETVIFARGGFKHWHDWLLKYKKRGNWLMIYAANTGRDRWEWWDIVFDDCKMANEIDRFGRYHFPFIKPTNEDVFYPTPLESDLKWDLCLGASHIHDKKGQYHCIKLMKVFHKKYGYYPSAIMPGSRRRSTHTLEMIKDPVYLNEVESPGMLTKSELSHIYDQCKVFLHLGTVGQNDRSVIEAYACGVPVVLRNLKAHTPLLRPNDRTIFHFDLDNDPDYSKSADHLYNILTDWRPSIKDKVMQDYRKKMSYEDVAIPTLRNLFRILQFEGSPSIRAKEHLQHAFRCIKDGAYGQDD